MLRLRTARTTAGTRLEASQVVGVPPSTAWDALVETTRWPEWSPVISGVESTDRRIRAGTTGRVRAPGVWLPFSITECSETERRWAWRLAGVPTAGHRVDDLGDGRCRVVFELPLHAAGAVPASLAGLESLADRLGEQSVEG